MSKKINKKALIHEISLKLGYKKGDVQNVVDELFGLIQFNLENDNIVNISKFGSFKVIHRKGKNGINPNNYNGKNQSKDSEEIKIAPRYFPVFRAYLQFKNSIKEKIKR